MHVMGSSEVGVDAICVLVVSANVVLWIVMVSLCVVVRSVVVGLVVLVIVVGIWVVGVVVSRVPVVMVSMVSSIVVLSHMKAMIAVPVVESMVIVMMVHRFHLQYQVSSRCVNIRWVENGGVCLKSARSLVPSARVKGIKVISPVEDELTSSLIVIENLNVVI